MGLKQLLTREVIALKRDVKRKQQRPIAIKLSEVRERMLEYPSILTRCNYILHRTTTAYEKVRYSPKTVRQYFHRANHGWNDSDTWSMDYALARQLDGQFESFIKRFDEEQGGFNGAPMSFSDAWTHDNDEAWMEAKNQEWLETLRTIRQGFRDYHMHFDNSYKLSLEDDIVASQKVHDGVVESLRLMGEHWEGLWW